jgi:2-dehydro-3-deoxyphosphogluconate aldolase / (4S)-4-hydroxy-2-oxoglutarate aldolase
VEKDSAAVTSLIRIPIVGIVRNISPDALKDILPVYYEAGLRNIEITMNTPSAVPMIKYALKNYEGKLNIGAGTVHNRTLLQEAVDAGASFIISPNTDETLIDYCRKINIPVIPGAFTPTEIYKAWSRGASIVKVFPATSLGAQFIKDVKAPLGFIRLMPTGGIDLHNIRDFLEAGAVSVGIGSHLFNRKFIEARDWQSLQKHFMLFMEKIVS